MNNLKILAKRKIVGAFEKSKEKSKRIIGDIQKTMEAERMGKVKQLLQNCAELFQEYHCWLPVEYCETIVSKWDMMLLYDYERYISLATCGGFYYKRFEFNNPHDRCSFLNDLHMRGYFSNMPYEFFFIKEEGESDLKLFFDHRDKRCRILYSQIRQAYEDEWIPNLDSFA